jgi:hypothetical protein
VIYRKNGKPGIKVEFSDSSVKVFNENKLPEDISTAIFDRTGRVKSLFVHIE